MTAWRPCHAMAAGWAPPSISVAQPAPAAQQPESTRRKEEAAGPASGPVKGADGGKEGKDGGGASGGVGEGPSLLGLAYGSDEEGEGERAALESSSDEDDGAGFTGPFF
jgi:hypothetical protein